ncbi:competence type IV pilus minor pilin ComGF [Lactococcus protaetiae]|uniref:Competence protein ComGF n=1 Tax=Lactococcus protaetiae TaxID=2592653 RepID=A0A514ZBA1_9LACT|nr:competence type IV pilus minor pilin ComGF [Lactococcus protaetiae]QDK71874.1 competence protein ComGF [Lactococcus protaetiae]
MLECLVALLAISGSVLVISGLTQLLQQQMAKGQTNQQKDWQIFCEQMRGELEGTKLDDVSQNFLYITKSKALRYGLVGNDFRKTDAQGKGYQPMLFGIKSCQILDNMGVVKIMITFDSGGKRTFVYKFEE